MVSDDCLSQGELSKEDVVAARNPLWRRAQWGIYLNVLRGDALVDWVSSIRVERENYRTLLTVNKIDLSRAMKVDPNVFNPLAKTTGDNNPWEAISKDEQLLEEIWKDVERTHSDHALFQTVEVRQRLQRILFHWCKQNNPSTQASESYRQGMNELLAVVYKAVSDVNYVGARSDNLRELYSSEHVEADTFAYFRNLMDMGLLPLFAVVKEVRKKQEPSSIGSLPLCRDADPVVSPQTVIQRRCEYIMGDLLKKHDTELHRWLAIKHKIAPQLFLLRWIRILFSREFTLTHTLEIWSSIFLDSYKHVVDYSLPFVDYFALAMLQHIRSELLEADQNVCMQLLMRFPHQDNVAPLIQRAEALRAFKREVHPPAANPQPVISPLHPGSTAPISQPTPSMSSRSAPRAADNTSNRSIASGIQDPLTALMSHQDPWKSVSDGLAQAGKVLSTMAAPLFDESQEPNLSRIGGAESQEPSVLRQNIKNSAPVAERNAGPEPRRNLNSGVGRSSVAVPTDWEDIDLDDGGNELSRRQRDFSRRNFSGPATLRDGVHTDAASEMQERIRELEAQLATSRRNVVSLDGSAQAQNEDFRRENVALTTENDVLKTQCAEATQYSFRQALETQVASLQAENDLLKVQCAEATQCSSRQAELETDVASLKAENDVLKVQCAEATQCSSRQAELETDFASLKAENDLLKVQCAEATQCSSRQAELETHVASLQAENDLLKSRFTPGGVDSDKLPSHASAENGMRKVPTSAADVPLTSAGDVPRLTSAADVPLLTSAADVPPLTSAVDVPLLTSAADVPPLTSAANVPPLNSAADVPPLTIAADVPPLNSAADVPPLTIAADVPPLTSVAAVLPSDMNTVLDEFDELFADFG